MRSEKNQARRTAAVTTTFCRRQSPQLKRRPAASTKAATASASSSADTMILFVGVRRGLLGPQVGGALHQFEPLQAQRLQRQQLGFAQNQLRLRLHVRKPPAGQHRPRRSAPARLHPPPKHPRVPNAACARPDAAETRKTPIFTRIPELPKILRETRQRTKRGSMRETRCYSASLLI